MRTILPALAIVCGALACGDDDPVPVDEIPPDTPVAQLGSAEWKGFCQWGSALARQKIPPGTMCNGIPISYSGCMRVPADCPATVAQVMTCTPAWLDRVAREPCILLRFVADPQAFPAFLEGTPGCEGFGRCATVTMM